MKILLCHMWMVIGGAETHVLELARGLAARGHDVTVASNGGVYVEALEAAGVRHVTVPLHTKKPSAMMESYKKLCALIKKERFDIVHAHSRIPAFLCGLLKKRLGFRFITSSHAVFKVNTMLRLLSDWGDHTFAVSCDIRQYLMDNYQVPSDNITLTINGIDTERFSAGAPHTDDAFRVLYVSRIDNETALPGFLLCEAAPALAKEIPGLAITIVGGGTALTALTEKARAVNEALGREVVTLTGPRTDIPDLCRAADVFVGVSRAALEAMACERPIVLAGQQGYIGVLDESVMELAKSTNFCCRGQRMPEAADIERDLITMYHMRADERAALGRLGRRIVLDGYSVARMADDHIRVYERMIPCRKYRFGDVIISGYYGFENIGDDSLLTAMIRGIKAENPEVDITVLAKHPRRLSRALGVHTINRFNIPKVSAAMRRAKLLISGGGSLLQDGTSKKSLFYYVTIMRMAKKRGMKLMLYANGLGPLGSGSSRQRAADIIDAADYVSLRENMSEALAREIGVKAPLAVTADPAFLTEPCEPLWRDHIKAREGITGRYFVVSVVDGNNFGEKNSAGAPAMLAAEIAAVAKKYDMEPVFVPMHRSRDIAVTDALCRDCGCGRVVSGLNAAELCGILADAELVIGTRLHMLIFAASMGVPMIGISYDPKIDAFLDYIHRREHGLDLRSIAPGQLAAAAADVMARQDEIRAELAAQVPALREKARSDCKMAAELFGGKQ
ncbi:MAG: polysaccharide pyruvyl transferase CsaB [Clostridia bacterium]|nr:polysaccharide pyruvyl transferase CsaB [Clostridia bacterium]